MTCTRACRLTGTGKSAVAVIGIRGPLALDCLGRCFSAAHDGPLQPGQVRYGHWQVSPSAKHSSPIDPTVDSADDELMAGESIVVTPLSDQDFEIHCHGGDAAVNRILQDLAAVGVQTVDMAAWPEPSDCLLLRETRDVLRRCSTSRTAALVHSQLAKKASGQAPIRMIDWVDRWMEILETPNVALPMMQKLLCETKLVLRTAAWTTRLDEPFRVVISGPANVGKSTLVNAIVGYQRSITFDQPGTTRDLLHSETVLDGFAVRLTDTAGLREVPDALPPTPGSSSDHATSDDDIEREGIRQVGDAIEDADMVVHVHDHQEAVERGRDALPIATARELWVRNKSDLGGSLSEDVERNGESANTALQTIATSGEGIDRLCEAIIARFASPQPRTDLPIAVTVRQRNCLDGIDESTSAASVRDHLRRLRDGDRRDGDEVSMW